MSDEKVQEILKAISNPIRLEILRKVRAGQGTEGLPCSCAMEGIGVSQSTFSHHISELCQCGLLVGRNQGRFVLLSVDEEVWQEFQHGLQAAVFGQMSN
jgi:DNA-binding transcriptional ArsR family regulator